MLMGSKITINPHPISDKYLEIHTYFIINKLHVYIIPLNWKKLSIYHKCWNDVITCNINTCMWQSIIIFLINYKCIPSILIYIVSTIILNLSPLMLIFSFYYICKSIWVKKLDQTIYLHLSMYLLTGTLKWQKLK